MCHHFMYILRSGTVNIEGIDELPGNTNITGKWFFRLEKSTGQLNAKQKCINWFKEQPDPRHYTSYLEPCPCSFRQARMDERFSFNWREWPKLCAYSSFPSVDGWGQECCYSTDWTSWGALILHYPACGSSHMYHKFTASEKHKLNDVFGYEQCCMKSSLCDLYYKRRPVDDCKEFQPLEWSEFTMNFHLFIQYVFYCIKLYE